MKNSPQDWDAQPVNMTGNTHLNSIVARAQSRRLFLKMGLGGAVAGFLSASLSAAVHPGEKPLPLLGFKRVPASSADRVTVADGYTARPFAPWGTPLFSSGPGAHWQGDGSDTAEDQMRQVGDNHDGMHFFPMRQESSDEGLLVLNHEYSNVIAGQYQTLFGMPAPADSLARVNKAMNACGCAVIHIRKDNGGSWQIVLDSPYNRRFTASTPMRLSGPAAGHPLLRTGADPTGRHVLGTFSNCGAGHTPWGTYLTCEENFNNNFGTTLDPALDGRTPAQKRYGLSAGRSDYGWEAYHARFDYKKEANEANRFGWVVEIDPFDPTSTPKKRTALGRFKHENAAFALARDQRVVIYMGDDQAHDYIYKFVSDHPFRPGQTAANRDLLDSGKLYVARFGNGHANGDFMGTGEWMLLDRAAQPQLRTSAAFPDQASVLIHARLAADLLGATKMDRPEWLAVHPVSGEVYVTLTNNPARRETDDANPRAGNDYGQIVRWREEGGDAGALAFEWDIFVLAGNPTVPDNAGTLNMGSANVTAENTFNSPDGLGFDRDGRLWIETDGKYSNQGKFANQGNNQLLAADPLTGEIRRFLVGPRECEITGMSFTPDSRTLFVNIQHPGEQGKGASHWPEGGNALPRSATLIITKDDGGVIGT